MKQTYIDEGIDGVETGNTIFISGLHGEKYNFINNKYGIVKDIYVQSDLGYVMYLADVELIETKERYSINFDFIYKIDSDIQVENPIQHLISIENPMLYYVNKKTIVDIAPMFDELGQYLSLSKDIKGKTYVSLLSGIN